MSSGNQDDTNRLVTFTIPMLAAAATALPVIFVITRMTLQGEVNLFPDFLLFAVYMWVLLWGTLSGERRWLLVLGIVVNIAIPILLMLIALKAGEVIGAHGVALLLLFTIAWYPTVILRECAGVALWRLVATDEERPMPATSSQASVIILFIIGSLIFIGGGIPTDSGDNTTVAIVFALPFTLCTFGLLSLARLIRKSHETPQQPIIISPNFLRRWIALMIGVLLMAAVLATILPKNPLQSLVARLNQSAQERERPSQDVFHGTSRVGQTTRRDDEGQPRSGTDTARPGNKPGSKPDTGTKRQPGQQQPAQDGKTRKPGTTSGPNNGKSPGKAPITVKPDSGAGKDGGHQTVPDIKPGKRDRKDAPLDRISGEGDGIAVPLDGKTGRGDSKGNPKDNEQRNYKTEKPGATNTGKSPSSQVGEGKRDGLTSNMRKPNGQDADTTKKSGQQPGGQQNVSSTDKPGTGKSGIQEPGTQPGKGKSEEHAETGAQAGKKDANAPSTPLPAQQPRRPNPFLLRVKDTTLSLLLYLAYLGEKDPPSIPMGNPVTPELVAYKGQMLKDAVRENPLRLVKLIIIGLLVLIGFGRFLWYLWDVTRRRFFRHPEPEVQEVMAQFDPFADPFEREHPSQEALIHAVYVTFLAHLWLRGYERQPSQTEFDFATWLEQNTPLNARPIWTITRACTYAEYAEQPLSPEEMTELHGALQTLMQDIRTPFNDAVLRERMQAYRELWAEREVAQRRTVEERPAE